MPSSTSTPVSATAHVRAEEGGGGKRGIQELQRARSARATDRLSWLIALELGKALDEHGIPTHLTRPATMRAIAERLVERFALVGSLRGNRDRAA